jgi:hydrogenase small subunit
MNSGGACIGCTMPGFPDKFSPFYKRAPGSAVSTTASATYGRVVRFLRGFTRESQNRETRWDKVGDIPSGWALQRDKEPLLERAIDFIYRKMQFSRATPPGRKVPETKYRDGWEVASTRREDREERGELKWGQARRRAKLEREQALKKPG